MDWNVFKNHGALTAHGGGIKVGLQLTVFWSGQYASRRGNSGEVEKALNHKAEDMGSGPHPACWSLETGTHFLQL